MSIKNFYIGLHVMYLYFPDTTHICIYRMSHSLPNPALKILQRNLNRSTFVVWEMKRNVSVLRLIVATRSRGPPASGKIIKEMPGSIASGTTYIYIYIYIDRLRICYVGLVCVSMQWPHWPPLLWLLTSDSNSFSFHKRFTLGIDLYCLRHGPERGYCENGH